MRKDYSPGVSLPPFQRGGWITRLCEEFRRGTRSCPSNALPWHDGTHTYLRVVHNCLQANPKKPMSDDEVKASDLAKQEGVVCG